MPAYVGLPNTHSVGLAPGYHGAAYLGVGLQPVLGRRRPEHRRLPGPQPRAARRRRRAERFDTRRGLLHAFDNVRRDVDASGLMDGLDRFGQDAYAMVTGPAARAAFDIRKESPRLRDRYGRHQWGQSALLARRLVEAGVRFVTLTFGGWDFHSSLEKGMHRVLPVLDKAVGTPGRRPGRARAARLDGRDRHGRVRPDPADQQDGRPRRRPGPRPRPLGRGDERAGGRRRVRRGAGSSARRTRRGEVPRDNPVTPADLLVTLYRQMGIDPETSFLNRAGPADLDRLDRPGDRRALLNGPTWRRDGRDVRDGVRPGPGPGRRPGRFRSVLA